MDQNATWYGGRPRPTPHCVRLGPSSPPPKGHIPQFSAHVCCDQTDGWIKTLLGTEVGLGKCYIVLDGNPAPSNKRGTAAAVTFRPISIVAKRSPISSTAEHLLHSSRPSVVGHVLAPNNCMQPLEDLGPSNTCFLGPT